MNPHFDPFLAMQQAVDIVLTSQHEHNKVAACLYKDMHVCAHTNEWPMIILERLGHEVRIGDSSGTIHAEINCLLRFPIASQGAAIAITDPCCPNCAKAITECGITQVYIDHKGFEKDFATRRGQEFQDMSLSIMAQAGIEIYKLNRKLRAIEPIHPPHATAISPEQNPIEVKKIPMASCTEFKKIIAAVRPKHESWGAALARNRDGDIFSLVASTHLAVGFAEQILQEKTSVASQKYSYLMTPLNRLICGAIKHGLSILDDYIFLAQLPTPREMVNAVGAGIPSLWIENMDKSSKETSAAARDILITHNILQFRPWNR
ncbi:MAG: deoxycytidylate deaminase [Alphaproteobacteria bacterium]|nr:deoxycytidylate deaminase [Alphaproteobacteria bacterium]